MDFTEEEIMAWNNSAIKELPVGEYVGILKDASFHVSKNDGSKSLRVTYDIVEPERFFGASYTQFFSLEPKRVFWSHKELLKLGIDPETKLQDLVLAVNVLCGSKVKFTLLQNGKYVNCTIFEVFKDDGEKSSTSDDIPF